MTTEGDVQVVAKECNGQPFLFPNDLCFGPDGQMYLTDSGVVITEFAPGNQIRLDYQQVNYQGASSVSIPLPAGQSRLIAT